MNAKRNRREVKVRNYPGVYRLEMLDDNGEWQPTGKYRAVRRMELAGAVTKESAFFDHISDCVEFRQGKIEKGEAPQLSTKMNSIDPNAYTFEKLLADWKAFAKIKIRESSMEFYERCQKHLESLFKDEVEKIDVGRIDKLIGRWKDPAYEKPKCRLNFERELDLLKTILHFYKRRKNPSYIVPIFNEHYEAGEIRVGTRNPVQHASADEFVRFVAALRKQKRPQYAPMAVLQFGCTLRIGEAAGIEPGDFFFQEGILLVKRTISWNRNDWSYRVHPVKNSQQRVVTLPSFVKEEMERYIQEVYPLLNKESGLKFLFQDKGRPIESKEAAAAYERAKKRAGLLHLDFSGTHWVRKSGATIGRDATGDSFAVQQLLDHSSLRETEKYTAKKLSHIKKVTDAIDHEFRLAQGEEQTPPPVPPLQSGGFGETLKVGEKPGEDRGNQTNLVERPVPQRPATEVPGFLKLVVSNS